MTSWLFPYDRQKFQLDRCLENQGFVEWHQLNRFQVGDIMYFYATAPVKRITHMMKVVKIDIKTEDTVDDSKFMTELYDIKLKSDPANFRVELIKRLKSEKLSSIELGKHGLKTKRIPIQKLNGDLLNYIEKIAAIIDDNNSTDEIDNVIEEKPLCDTTQIETKVAEKEIVTSDIVEYNPMSFERYNEEFKTLKLSFYDDNSVVISCDDKSAHSDDSIVNILVKKYAQYGYVLLVFNTGEIAKISVQSLCSIQQDKRIGNCINPHKISNYFTVASDCIIGSINTKEDGNYIEMCNSSNIQEVALNDIKLNNSFNGDIIKRQPFILPLNNEIKGIKELFNKRTKQTNISIEISKALKSYGVYI